MKFAICVNKCALCYYVILQTFAEQNSLHTAFLQVVAVLEVHAIGLSSPGKTNKI